MITVNLRPGLKRARAGSPLAGLAARTRELVAKVQDPMLLGAIAFAVLVGAGVLWVGVSNASTLRELEPQLQSAKDENRRFKNFVAQKRREERIRDSLLAQINVIRQVDGDRYVWPHVMDEVAKALPSYTWLVDVGTLGAAPGATPAPAAASGAPSDSAEIPALQFQINGRTVDIQAYTRFLRQLEASPWISDVTPLSAQTIVEQERPVTAFAIRAIFRKADSAYIRTVPLGQSVR